MTDFSHDTMVRGRRPPKPIRMGNQQAQGVIRLMEEAREKGFAGVNFSFQKGGKILPHFINIETQGAV